jgi:outer membrane murein-binding lipoprotein Lpp
MHLKALLFFTLFIYISNSYTQNAEPDITLVERVITLENDFAILSARLDNRAMSGAVSLAPSNADLSAQAQISGLERQIQDLSRNLGNLQRQVDSVTREATAARRDARNALSRTR